MQRLSDQDIAQNMLKDEKFICDMINGYVLEAANDDIRRDWTSCLQSSYSMQKQVFDAMSQKGWYSPAKAQPQQISQAQTQFSQNPMQS